MLNNSINFFKKNLPDNKLLNGAVVTCWSSYMAKYIINNQWYVFKLDNVFCLGICKYLLGSFISAVQNLIFSYIYILYYYIIYNIYIFT